MADNPLRTYHEKRDFRSTPEPRGKVGKADKHMFVIQKHDATRLHYDFRLELDGVMKSWAVTRGPSLDPAEKRLAVRTEDHPTDYAGFEGVIPKGYGAGTVMLWDRGTWAPKGNPHDGLKKGVLKFELDGERLRGGFALIRMKNKKGEKRENWLLVKERDTEADEATDPTRKWTSSVASARSLQDIAKDGENYKKGRTYKPGVRPTKEKATRKSKPTFVSPQLASLRDTPPSGDDWLHEIKYDGYRIQAVINDGSVRLLTRNRKDWTARFPAIAGALSTLSVETAVIDGELVAVDADGHSDFGRLQRADGDLETELRYYPFDLLHHDGSDLTGQPLLERKEILHRILSDAPDILHYSDHIAGDGSKVIEKACALNLEGIISKRADTPYRSGRSTSWIKSKCVGRDEFIIGGYRRSDKKGRAFSSLLLGEYEGERLVYRGRVGTGFDERTMDDLAGKLQGLSRKTTPFADMPSGARDRAEWVTPKLVAQIAYTEKTSEGRLRHPSFLGLRDDKPASEVTVTKEPDDAPIEIADVRLTSPDKVMFPEQGATKRQIAEYYAEHGRQVLDFLKDRPLSLVRCPSGRDGDCFFQKHHNKSVPGEIDQVMVTEKDGKKSPYLLIQSVQGLVAAAQIGALELHLWGARQDRIERPERIVFDLDPDEGMPFRQVREAAF